MNDETWVLTDDLGTWGAWVALGLGLAALLLLVFELKQRERAGVLIFSTGLGAVLLFTLAVLRPAEVHSKSTRVGARVAVLFDNSRRLLLGTSDGTRRARGLGAVEALTRHYAGSRLDLHAFGDASIKAFEATQSAGFDSSSDLASAMAALRARAGERPRALIVVSDGRLTRPEGQSDALQQAVGVLGVPVHTVRLEERVPKDASIRKVSAAGAAVAHQSLSLRIEVGCEGLQCDEIPVTVKELRDGVASALLATAQVRMREGVGEVEVEITLDRAGARVVEVSLTPPAGDEVPENDTRLLTFTVTRDRVRLLHLAGRPTYDVRALRRWLKGDEAVDTVAFFILRGETDDPGASESDLALIRFPVDELFTEHLPSFDAVILQDIDAVRYQLARYLERLTAYVQSGGGLIMVGGPSSFAGGNYAGTPLDEILPVEQPRDGKSYDSTPFVPVYTQAGRAAAITHVLRGLLAETLPSMAGANVLGAPRPGAIVLWEHPSLKADGAPMPIMALGEAGDGRSIALAVDSTHELGFSKLAAGVAGRSYGALWDGLLGWLMRDPRYEAARVDVLGECIAGEPVRLKVTRLPGMKGRVSVELGRLQLGSSEPLRQSVEADTPGPIEVSFDVSEPGGYTAKVSIGAAPPTRLDFGCERGGVAFSDSRPDPERLELISRVTGGRSVDLGSLGQLPQPEAQQVSAERSVTPILAPWIWTLAASVLLGAHWITRRFSGLA